MATNVKNIASSLMNDYIDTINDFVGEKIIERVSETFARKINNSEWKFFEKLAHKIYNVRTKRHCSRNCPFRRK